MRAIYKIYRMKVPMLRTVHLLLRKTPEKRFFGISYDIMIYSNREICGS